MCYSQHHLYLMQYTILKYSLDMCNLEQSEVIPPLSPKEGEGGKTWLCCSRNCYWSNRWIPFVIVVICTSYLQSFADK